MKKTLIAALIFTSMFMFSVTASAQEASVGIESVNATNVAHVDESPATPDREERGGSSSGGRSTKYLLLEKIELLKQLIALLEQYNTMLGK